MHDSTTMVPIRNCSAVASGTAEESVERRQTHRNVSDKFAGVSEELHRPLLDDDTQSEVVTLTDELCKEAPKPLFPRLSGVCSGSCIIQSVGSYFVL